MDQRLSYITLGVDVLERAIRFYCEGLGLTLAKHQGEYAYFEFAGFRLALYPRTELAKDARAPNGGQGFSGVVLSHNVVGRQQVDDILEQARRAGAEITKPGQETFWGGYSGYFRDPDGHYWEIAWNPQMAIEGPR